MRWRLRPRVFIFGCTGVEKGRLGKAGISLWPILSAALSPAFEEKVSCEVRAEALDMPQINVRVRSIDIL